MKKNVSRDGKIYLTRQINLSRETNKFISQSILYEYLLGYLTNMARSAHIPIVNG